MVDISELRICKSCGNVFSKKAGASLITECPQCHGTNFDFIEMSNSEEVYLEDID